LAFGLVACKGDQGPVGKTGAKGTLGDKGDIGAPGPAGKNGTNGTNGADGAKGEMGAMGAMGDPGAMGAMGTPGVDGSDGANGTNGTDGTNGTNGTNGTDGTNGTNGTNGADGTNGTNGTNGNDVIISDRAKHGLDISPVAIDTTGMTSAQIEAIGEGSYLANALADCGACHGEAGTTPGFLAGTTAAGSFNARNLTPDPTTGMKLTEDEFVNVMRIGADYSCDANGCTATGKTISAMAWPDFRWASIYDLKAIYAYLKAIPAVSNQVAADTGTHATNTAAFPTDFVDGAQQRPLPLEADLAGKAIPDPDFARRGMSIQPLTQVTSSDAKTEAQIGRGSYLVNSLGRCNGCHTNPARTSASPTSPINTAAWFTGGRVFSFTGATQSSLGVVRSMAADLVGATNGFFGESTADFVTFEGILQTGVHVDDALAPAVAAPMPWQHLRDLTVEDLESIYTYLAAVQADQPSPLTADKATEDASYYCIDNTRCDTGAGESCDLASASATFHECIGRTSCATNTDCRACQTCDTGTHICGGPVDATCKASGI
jgi:hypothetical protein